MKRVEKELETSYRYGKIKELKYSRDGIAWSAVVEYQNAEEQMKRTTTRGIRELLLIQHIEDAGVEVDADELS